MRIGIVTITELDNFGNRLQNYALQEILKSFGADVETIPNYITYRYRKSKKYIISEIALSLRHRNRHRLARVIKQIRFAKFDKKHFTFSNKFSEMNFISENINDDYDYFIAGSDQIWNPYFPFNLDFNFLTFCEYKKRIAYAASFGVEHLPENYIEQYRKYLEGLRCISVREFSGSNIVYNITGKKIDTLLDPSLLLNCDAWSNIAKKPKWMKKDIEFILVYFLDKSSKKEQLITYVKKHKEYRECQIIDIFDAAKIKEFSIDPLEFLWLVKNANIMITDSFHGTVFSILFGIPFINAKRESGVLDMNTRIESLCTFLKLHMNDGINKQHIVEKEKLENILKNEREKASQYLLNALNLY